MGVGDYRAFALHCAREVLHLWAAPQDVRDYLTSADPSQRLAARSACRGFESSAQRAAIGACRDDDEKAATNAHRAAAEALADAAYGSHEFVCLSPLWQGAYQRARTELCRARAFEPGEIDRSAADVE